MSRAATILVVEDEEAIRELVCRSLGRMGYRCIPVADAADADAEIAASPPDLILLDWMLPGKSGFELARQLKQKQATREIPVIMLTARAAEQDKVRSLDAGADDYVTKPFSMAELGSRINAVLRRSAGRPDHDVVEIAGLRVDAEAHRVEAGGNTLALSPTEFRLLAFLVKHPERAHSRSKLLDQVWGDSRYVDERTVDVHIRRLRKALSPGGHDRLIQTVRGAGYRLSLRD
jgi:two-component system phosphate regulon response regulator PhoB